MKNNQKYFVKIGSSHQQNAPAMFAAEAQGLEALCKHSEFHVPRVLATGHTADGTAVLVTDALELNTLTNHRQFGQLLARQHQVQGPEKFGFSMDGFIGSTPQPNPWTDNWVDFLRLRLEHQFRLAQFAEPLEQMAQELLRRLPELFEGICVCPSLLHGDLWFGNCGQDGEGRPVVFDPAAYWGHAEAELGIMRMFGGFHKDVFEAYHEILPREKGFERRALVYELYHTVNHYIIFGGGYLGQCEQLLRRALAQ
ncbi:hypothetical protein GGI07_000573 [Coemansia sp. Benny D115]|nr:hypothetical protein GGI07_000573 [Coemansia sp. Benny D115]